MSSRIIWGVLLFFVGHVLGAEPATGFQADRVVRQATSLDWKFVVGRDPRLPSSYDSRKVRYQLFVPPAYSAKSTWPLVLVLSSGDAPLAWRDWKDLCEAEEILFCSAHGAGNDCPPAERFRLLCDMLDDIRRDYRIDPDRTYAIAADGATPAAMRLVTSLPELFGGVALINGGVELPSGDEPRLRLRERLSVALVCGEKSKKRSHLESFALPLFTGLAIRTKLWTMPLKENAPSKELTKVFTWLDEDRKRRQADSTKLGGVTGEALAKRLLERAREDLRDSEKVFRAAARLEWLTERFARTATGRKAGEVLDEVRADRDKSRALLQQGNAERRRVQHTLARALQGVGRTTEARRAWLAASKLAAAPEQRKKDEAEAERLAVVLERTPYLGLTLAGTTSVVRSLERGGPAAVAGLRVGDRIDRIGKVEIDSLAAVREVLKKHKPGELMHLVLRRGDEVVKAVLKVGSTPAE